MPKGFIHAKITISCAECGRRDNQQHRPVTAGQMVEVVIPDDWTVIDEVPYCGNHQIKLLWHRGANKIREIRTPWRRVRTQEEKRGNSDQATEPDVVPDHRDVPA